jgi:hypothetical protein
MNLKDGFTPPSKKDGNQSMEQLNYFLEKRKEFVRNKNVHRRMEIEKKQFAGGDSEKNLRIVGPKLTINKEEALKLLESSRKRKPHSFGSSEIFEKAKKAHSSNVSFIKNKSSSNSENERRVKLFSLKNSTNSYSLFGAGKISHNSHSSSFSKHNLKSKLRFDGYSVVGSDSNMTFRTQSYSFSYGGPGPGNTSLQHGRNNSSKNSN